MGKIEFILIRKYFSDFATLGELYLDGKKLSDTLEDKFRKLPPTCPNTPRWVGCKCPEKKYGITCIPPGRYEVEWRYSPRFGKWYPGLKDVPHFLGILIHAGATPSHTEGCILTGNIVSGRERLTNQFAVTEVIKKIVKNAHDKKKKMYINIKHEDYVEGSK